MPSSLERVGTSPTATRCRMVYGYRDVLVRGNVDADGDRLRVRGHRMTYPDMGGTILSRGDPCVPLLERKIAVQPLDQDAQPQGWASEELGTFRRLLAVNCMGCKRERARCSVPGDLPALKQEDGGPGIQDASPAGGPQLRRRETPGAVPAGGAAAPAGWSSIPTCHESG